jgi:hypothetical protein
MLSVPQALLERRMTILNNEKLREIEDAIHFALGLSY